MLHSYSNKPTNESINTKQVIQAYVDAELEARRARDTVTLFFTRTTRHTKTDLKKKNRIGASGAILEHVTTYMPFLGEGRNLHRQ